MTARMYSGFATFSLLTIGSLILWMDDRPDVFGFCDVAFLAIIVTRISRMDDRPDVFGFCD